jgi:CheY-like chemotaxis protein
MTPSTAGRSVLVVDDDTDSREALVDLLAMLGHEPWGARDADAALAVAKRVRPEVALIDIVLPEMSGHDLARRLRVFCRDPRIRLIALTGLADSGTRRQALEAGFDFFVTKPCSAEGIAALLTLPS